MLASLGEKLANFDEKLASFGKKTASFGEKLASFSSKLSTFPRSPPQGVFGTFPNDGNMYNQSIQVHNVNDGKVVQ